MSMTTAVTDVMTRRLSKLGYPTNDVRWSLGYCQGDGASFTGKLDISVLGARLLPDVSPDVWKGVDLDLELTRSGRYVHERSTSLNYDLECIIGSDPEELGGAAQKVALGKLFEVLEDDVVSAGAEMASDGYKVLESYIQEKTLVRTFNTKNFSVQVWTVEDEHSSPFEFCDESFIEETIRSVLAEEIYFGGVKVVVLQVDEDGDELAELATADCGGVEWARSDSVFKTGVVRDLVHEAVLEARETFARINRPKLKKAA